MKGAKITDRRGGVRVLLQVVILCAWAIASILAVQMVLSFIMWFILRDNLNKPVWTAIYSALMYGLSLLLIVYVPPKFMSKWTLRVKTEKSEKISEGGSLGEKPGKKLLGFGAEVTWMDVGLAPIAYVISTLLAAGLVALFNNFSWFNAAEAQTTGFGIYMNAPERIIAFLTLCILAPVAEEVIFRGWLYGKIREKLHPRLPTWTGVLISTLVVSVVFGVVHGQWNVGVNVFALSVVLCLLREITGTIYAGMFTHMIKNAVAFYLLYVLGFGV